MLRRRRRQQRHEITRDRAEPVGTEPPRVGEHQPCGVLTGRHDQPGRERVIEAVRAAAALDARIEQLRDPLGEHPPAAPDPLAQLARAAARRHQHQPPGARIRFDRAEEAGDGVDKELLRFDRLVRRGADSDDLEQRRQRGLLLPVDQGEHHSLQVAEHVVHDRAGHAGLPGDRLDGDRVSNPASVSTSSAASSNCSRRDSGASLGVRGDDMAP